MTECDGSLVFFGGVDDEGEYYDDIWFFKNVGLTSTNELTDIPVNWSETYNTVSEDDSK